MSRYRFCSYPRCGTLVPFGRCAAHRYGTHTDHTSYELDMPLPPASYNLARWRRESKQFLADHPFCVDCQSEGGTGLATEVDHDVPHRGDRALFWDQRNWRARCHSHHSRKTAQEVGWAAGR